jgi:hypothetical protein
MATVGYIAATVPAKIDRVSNTTLWRIAVTEFGDPLRWVEIAQLNGLIDPWVTAPTDILIPPTLPKLSAPPTGILGQ